MIFGADSRKFTPSKVSSYTVLQHTNHLLHKIIWISVVSHLLADSVSISCTEPSTAYCPPLSITINLHMSFIRIVSSLKTYHTREWITVPDPSGVCKNSKYIIAMKKLCVQQNYYQQTNAKIRKELLKHKN